MANKLREFRKKARLTQGDLADRIGTSRSTIVKLERGERRLSAPWLEKLAPILKVTQGEILGDSPPAAGPALPLQGCLMGDGTVADLPLSLATQKLHLPPGLTSDEGLEAWVMGDHSMGREVSERTLMIVADPRRHFFPIVPGALLVFRRDKQVFIRQFVEGADGHAWLTATPETPDPSFPTFRFNAGMPKYSRHAGTEAIAISEIEGAVLWEHKSRMPMPGL